ncbi:MAG: lasso peptide biosynthesis B2 protein [Anaerolineae bacterium]|nr:lasso peptide biosynthesis B2 protein [Anaerolineae bacterium]
MISLNMVSSALARKLRAWQLFSADERNLFVLSVLLLVSIRGVMKLLGFRRTKNILERVIAPQTQRTTNPELARVLARIVAMARRNLMFEATCLEHSLTLWLLLRRRGLAGKLVMGTRLQNGAFEGHAWIEYEGQVINDTADVTTRYAVLLEVEEPAS